MTVDLDIKGAVLSEVVALDGEFVIRGAGGVGEWFEGGQLVKVDTVTEVLITCRITDRKLARYVLKVLEKWRTAGTELRIVGDNGANGGVCYFDLFDPKGLVESYLRLPRSAPGEDG